MNTDNNIFPNKAEFILHTPVLEDNHTRPVVLYRAEARTYLLPKPPAGRHSHCHKHAGEQPREHDFHSTDFVAESFLLTGGRCEVTAERSGYGSRKGMELESSASRLSVSLFKRRSCHPCTHGDVYDNRKQPR